MAGNAGNVIFKGRKAPSNKKGDQSVASLGFSIFLIVYLTKVTLVVATLLPAATLQK